MTTQALQQINDPVSRAKLEGIQETVSDLDVTILETRDAIKTKRGVVDACAVLGKRLFNECIPINAQVDAETMTPDEAKIRIDQIKKLVSIVDHIGAENRTDLIKFEGKIIGLEAGIAKIGARFVNEANKYLRHERMEAEDDDDWRGTKQAAVEGGDDGDAEKAATESNKKSKPKRKYKKRTKKTEQG